MATESSLSRCTTFEIDEYFIKVAENISKESPCFKSQVGAILVKGLKVISQGFNRSPRNQKDCKQIGWCHRIKNNIKSGESPNLCRAFGCHAEQNAISDAARRGIAIDGATMYIFGNTEICLSCRGTITNAGIKMVVYKSKLNTFERINVEYDWSIHPLDQGWRLDEWESNMSQRR